MVEMQTLEARIAELAAPFLAEGKFELIELHCRKTSGEFQVQILADRIQGGITIEECALLNRNIAGELNSHNLIPEGFTLEVSSPGLDRPLTSRRDFERVLGKPICVSLKEPFTGRREFAGVLREVSAEALKLESQGHSRGQNQQWSVPLEHIIRGVRLIE